MSSLRLAALVLCVCLWSCGGDERVTQLVVVVESDLPVPGQLHSVLARVGGDTHPFALTGPDAVTVPFSFAIAPRGRDASRQVGLIVEGRAQDRSVLVRRSVRTAFVEGATKRLVVRLEAACLDVTTCGAGETCVGGACVDDTVDAATLPDVIPGQELMDAGPRPDGSADAQVVPDGGDAALDDAGLDGGGLDAGDGEPPLPPVSCEGTTGSGPRTIDPDGAGPIAPFVVWCDEGWTLLLKVRPDSPRLAYDGPEWAAETSAAAFGEPTPGAEEDALLAPYWALPISRLRIVMSATGHRGDREVPLSGAGLPAPLRSIVLGGAEATLGGDAALWGAILGESLVSSPSCQRAGIPAEGGGSPPRVQVRIGIVLSTDSDCDPVGGWIGVGARAVASGMCVASANAAGGARLCGSPPGSRLPYPRFTVVYGR